MKNIARLAIDPLQGTHVIHGATGKRPKAYAGEFIDCPWDTPKNVLLTFGSAFLTINDFPAFYPNEDGSVSLTPVEDDLYPTYNIHGECLLVIYTSRHDGHFLTLTDKERHDVVGLWQLTTDRSRATKGCVYTQIFENDGPTNSMHHPHGQQYNIPLVPPQIAIELARAKTYWEKTKTNLFTAMVQQEAQEKERIVSENTSFIAFSPIGSRWPYQLRVLPKRPVLWVTELTEKEQHDLAAILADVRKAYNGVFTGSYKPTIMQTLVQAPFDTKEDYRSFWGFRVEFYNTALTPKAEKLMFSIENSTGLVPYSDTSESIAHDLRQALARTTTKDI